MSHQVDSAPLSQRIAEALTREPGIMTPFLARQLKVAELEVMRSWPTDDVAELDATRMEEIIRRLESLGMVHVICNNGACVLETHGRFGGFSHTPPFLNVFTKSLDMHIMLPRLVAAFCMTKPSHQDGQQTYSVQFFQEPGIAAFKVFLYKSLEETDGATVAERVANWKAIRDTFRR